MSIHMSINMSWHFVAAHDSTNARHPKPPKDVEEKSIRRVVVDGEPIDVAAPAARMATARIVVQKEGWVPML
jgi:hypothetical protein